MLELELGEKKFKVEKSCHAWNTISIKILTKHLSSTNHVERFVTKSLLSVFISSTHNERALIRITVIVFRGKKKHNKKITKMIFE